MKKVFTLLVAAFALSGGTSPAVEAWIHSGVKTCIFNADKRERLLKCEESYRKIPFDTEDGRQAFQYEWRWASRDGFEVRYKSYVGLGGKGTFTIGELTDSSVDFPPYPETQAVSYDDWKDGLIIGVPGELYRFRVVEGL